MLVDNAAVNITRYRETHPHYGGAEVTRRIFEAAQKFAFDAPTVEAAFQLWPNEISEEELQKRLPFCRLPFHMCWFEFPWKRSKYGFLLRSEGDFQKFDGLCVAEGRDKPSFLGEFTYEINEGKAIITGPTEAQRNIYEAFGWMLMRLLFALNIKNLVTREFVDKTSHNQKRARKGRPPLFSYHVCRIRPSTRSPAAADQTGESRGVRAHLVRGHLKARKTGVFMWSPHARGDAGLGVVHKEYRI
jgi:hypothetical protein